MEVDDKVFLKYSGIENLEELEDEVMEWIDRSKRKSKMGGYDDRFCAKQILMIFYCVIHKLREEVSHGK